MTCFRNSVCLGALAAATAALAQPAIAQSAAQDQASAKSDSGADSAAPGEIIVTAQKRAENVQSVPLAVSVVGPTQLKAAGVTQFQDLGKIAPSLTIRPAEHPANANVSLRGDPLRAMAMFNIPLGMQGLAEAARERREAARHDIEDLLLEARQEAQVADAARLAARATDETAQAMLAARHAAFVAARAAVEVEPDAFQRYAGAASEYAKAAADRRRAAAALAVADVRHAVAYGWPQPSQQEEIR